MRTPSIQLKFVLVLVLVLFAGGAWVLLFANERSIRQASESATLGAARLYAGIEETDVEKLSSTLEALTTNDALKAAFRSRDRGRLLALARPLFEKLESRFRVTHWYFVDPDRTCFLRVHRPELFGDRIDRTTMLRAEKGGAAAGKELGKTAFALRSVRAWYDGDQLIGYLELGEEIDHFLGRMKDLSGDDYALLLSKKNLNREAWRQLRQNTSKRDEWDDRPELVLVDSTGARAEWAAHYEGSLDRIPEGGEYLGLLSAERRTFSRGVVPIRDVAGATVGALVTLHDVTILHDGILAARLAELLGVVAALVIVTLAIVYMLNRLVFRRLRSITAHLEIAATRLAGGDYEVANEIASSSSDEIGQFEGFFSQFLGLVGTAFKELEQRAKRTG